MRHEIAAQVGLQPRSSQFQADRVVYHWLREWEISYFGILALVTGKFFIVNTETARNVRATAPILTTDECLLNIEFSWGRK